MLSTYALVMLLTFSDSAATADKSQLNVLDTGLTYADCLARADSHATIVHSDSFVTVSARAYCEREPIE